MSMSISDARKRDKTLLEQAEDELREIAQQRAMLTGRYQTALIEARKVGMSNAKIASIMGISEAAVRMYMKRKDLR